MATITNERDALYEIIRILNEQGNATSWMIMRHQILEAANKGIKAGDLNNNGGNQQDNKTWLTSSTITIANYFPATRILRLHFTSGAIYEYFEVHPSTWNDLKAADSPGRYYNSNIKQHENKKLV